MQIDDAELAEFQALHERVFGRRLSIAEAREMVSHLLTLYDLLLRPLPRAASDDAAES
jgi:hypothetical protein